MERKPLTARDQIRPIRAGKADQTILTFNGAYKELKEAIKRGAELSQVLTEPQLHDLGRARTALDDLWPFLKEEPDPTGEVREHAKKLADLMARETFFRELPAIDEHTRALIAEHKRGHDEAVQARAAAYEEAANKLRSAPGWEQLAEDQQQRVAEPLVSRAMTDGAVGLSIPLLRADLDAFSGLLSKAVEEMLRLLDGNRVVRVTASSYFSGGIETEEADKKVLVQ